MTRCPYCKRPAELVSGAVIYPHRPDLEGKRFHRCEPCRAWVGCHPGTTIPLGRLANDALRRAKRAAHEAFDPLWKNRHMRRNAAYKWLAERLGIPPGFCHIGAFDEAECARVVEVMHGPEALEIFRAPAHLPNA